MRRAFHTLDVFTETPLAGNPLAVVLDSQGLDDARMQSIAREFNLAETVFVSEPKNPVNTAAVRIFTPARELPFAGHPTVGTAVLLAHLRAPELLKSEDLRIVLEEKVGDVVCVARHRKGQAMAAYFTVPRAPERMSEPPSKASLAADLGLEVEDIGFDAHEPVVMGAGTANLFVPLKSLAAMGRARPDHKRWGENGGPCLYLYTRESVHAGSDFHARMFAAGWGVYEDPATGSAAAAFAGVMMAFEKPRDGEHVVTIEQGVEMGRPSFISVGLDVADGVLRSATIGGSAVIVCEGKIDL
ncbi:MAG: PhzF family phenazine biosynthesis protein [Roseiarcus sp.]